MISILANINATETKQVLWETLYVYKDSILILNIKCKFVVIIVGTKRCCSSI